MIQARNNKFLRIIERREVHLTLETLENMASTENGIALVDQELHDERKNIILV